MFDLLIQNTRLACDGTGPLVDIGVAGGRIAAIGPGLPSGAETIDAKGCLACAGFCESHIHLDKSRITGRTAPPPGRDAQPMRRVSEVKHTMTGEDILARARLTLEAAISHGTMRMRAHCEIDPLIGLRGYHAVKQLARDYAWAIDIEICVFPQEGLTNSPGTDELLVAALRDGARVIGAVPSYDSDPNAQLVRIYQLAREYDVDIDMHLDNGDSAAGLDIHRVIELTEEYGWGGRVAVGHMTKLSALPLPDMKTLACRIAAAGVAVTVLPATDLFLMGRHQTHDIRRGVADAHALRACGVTCALATNNVLNPFTPFGDASLIRAGNLQANIAQRAEPEDLAAVFSMLTDAPARLMNLPDYGIAVGNPADIVLLDAESASQTIAELRPPLAAFKRGRRSLTRPRPTLHAPQDR